MGKEIICLDTSLFIDYFRKQRKDRTLLAILSKDYDFSISVITKLEIGVGIGKGQKDFWDDIFEKLTILPITEVEIDKACEIIQSLRRINKIIGLQDILIASTAIVHDLKLATLNLKYFERVQNLTILKL